MLLLLHMEWTKYIPQSILRFNYNKNQSDEIDEILEKFRGDKSVSWCEEDGSIEVCVYSSLSEFYEQKEPLVVQVYEWIRGKGNEGFDVPIPLKYDLFLDLVDCSGYVSGDSEENVLSLINKKNRLKVKRRLRRLFWREPLEVALKRAIEILQKKAR